MDSVVIVALPAVDDKVWRISSEKVPHLTLLYLDAAVVNENQQAVIEHVKHAASFLDPFGMTVDYRGTLGVDEADVLFFEKTEWNIGDISDFRHYCLMNDTIKRAYDSADQFPEWTPHLTLGYPTDPALKDTDEYPGIRHVQFDRIAVWVGEYDGPEFRLKYQSNSLEVAMGTIEDGAKAAEEVLAHYGVKGMHWGVRRAEKLRETADRSQRIADGTATRKDKIDQAVLGKGLGGRGGVLTLHPAVAQRLANKYGKKADKAEAKLEEKQRKADAIEAHKKWKEEAGGTEMANKVFQKAAKDFEKTADIINNDPNYKGKDVTKGTLAKQYQATMNHYFNEHLAQASVDLTINDQGRAYIYQFDARTGMMRGREYQATDIGHAESKFQMPDYKVELDDNGHMVGFTLVGELFHYGVKGMRWGYTTKDGVATPTKSSEKTSRLTRGTKEATVTQRKAGTYVKAKGGQRHKAADDAVRTQAARQIAKKSTTDALSNKQLKDTIERMRLEQEFAKLDKKVSRKGNSFVSRLLQSDAAKETTADLLKKATAAAAAS